ncbi:MAG: FixH family protein [Thauera sp.]|nr:FixH family protein [Thauera sp.]
MRSKKSEAPIEPWYRQGWPWFLIALPATAVVAGVATLVIAAKTFDGMVVDDYYKEGQAIVQTLGRVEHARELGLRAALRIRSDSIHVELTATAPGSLPDSIRLTVAHPTRGGLDQELLVRGRSGVYETALAPLSTGRWLFVIQDEARSWRMDGSAYLPAEMEIRMDPNV